MNLDKIKNIRIFDGSVNVFESNCDSPDYDINDGVLDLYLNKAEGEISYTKSLESDDSERIKITALLKLPDENIISTWIEYKKKDDDDFEVWDNDIWILDELKLFVNNEITIENCKCITHGDILSEDKYLIRKLLDKAIELGFFKK